MKKSFLLLSILLSIFACKDEETTPTFKQDEFLGKWEVTESSVADEGSDDCDNYRKYYEFTADEFATITECSGMESSISIEYTFNGKNKITFEFFVTGEIIIKELTETKMVIDEYISGQKAGTSTLTKVD